MQWLVDFWNSLTPSIKSTIIITIALLIFIVIIRILMRNYDSTKPAKGLILFVEKFVKLMNNFSKEMMGKRFKIFAPYFITLSVFLFVANISGLFGLTPPTTSITVTGTLALITFLMIQIFGIVSTGAKTYLKDLCTPIPMTPMNIIGELAFPLSLAFRLFGNILSGAILTTLVYSFFGWLSIIITPPLHLVFDIGFGLIQTLVFVILSADFIDNKFRENEFE